ncbi:MAG: class I SAM-dependent methyltransferase [Sporichthyaceae bacterium]
MATAARTGYQFDNGWEHAQARLRSLERVYDPATTRRLAALDVGPGWRCLEVGAGGGSIARWLCSRVAPTGRVLAVDLDTRFVSEIRATNLDVARLDVTTDDLPRDAYDLVHARAVLAHLPERTDVLAKLVSALKPGGRLLLEEADVVGSAALNRGLHSTMLGLLDEAIGRAGYDSTWARDLPDHLAHAGLVDIGAETEVPLTRGESAGADLLRLTVRQARDQLLEVGATPDQLEAWETFVSRPSEWFRGIAVVAAWGRRP